MSDYPERPEGHEEKYIDLDEGTDSWGVFGLDSGFCYSLHASEKAAEAYLKKE